MTTINAPANFTGRSYVGPHILDFTDGVAEYDGELNDGARAYMESMGYGIDSAAAAREDEEPPVDTPEVVEGAPLRDAAVDPHPEDFCAPLNAGVADPHGPLVIAIEVGSEEYQRRVDAMRAERGH